jgi:hypothetical protein
VWPVIYVWPQQPQRQDGGRPGADCIEDYQRQGYERVK